MSFTAGGPRRDDFFKLPGQNGAGAPPEPGAKAPVDRTAALPVGAFRPVTPMPQRLFEHERERAAARADGDTIRAERALRSTVADLDVALATAVVLLRAAEHPKVRERVAGAIADLVAASEAEPAAGEAGVAGDEAAAGVGRAAYRPLQAVALFLGLAEQDVSEVVDALTEHGVAGPIGQATARVDELRERLRKVEATRDQVELDRLLTSLAGIATVVSIAGAATPLGALSGGDPRIADAAKSGVVALTAVVLQEADGEELVENACATAETAYPVLLAALTPPTP
ncbi:hypothetical protein Kfla_1811 [Kribbella flavida DSM 17836]|uniref:Uncharacterized protein n=1 Tax=Kribbella flavida (strain DSM 17836 / JCM 10339 / NBRC 14399) TaxID=479435 RepID=D2PPE3_KRIFD|nr:hypothetical protein [Kribbella flavida]ADB30905.1 hypothetical protein Kfla_1811 [Kribbella flavida DSM 17836]